MKKLVFTVICIAILLSGCSTFTDRQSPYHNQVEELLAQMTLEEKIGQMTQIEKGNITPAEVTSLYIGSVLSGGGGSPWKNNPEAWAEMVNEFQDAALATRLKIPLIYGVDAVHGHANVKGATVFPQNIGLGAADDIDLMRLIGHATAKELWATGIPWNFGPVVAVPQDIRWGRTYEGFGEDTELVTRLAIPYLQGAQNTTKETPSMGNFFTLATAKHYIGDGGTVWGSKNSSGYKIDQGDMQMEESELRRLFLPPYQAAVDAEVGSVMASFNSWNGQKLHADKYMLTDVLKDELGFDGFVVSDWQAIDQISPDYYEAVVTAINAGIDMNMVPYNPYKFIDTMKEAVENGDIPMERLDDAVRRILTVKFELGLFEQPYSRPEFLDSVGSHEHR
jgi:beta-glucosidase